MGVFNLETRCAFKDERGTAFNKGQPQLQGVDCENVMRLLSAQLSVFLRVIE